MVTKSRCISLPYPPPSKIQTQISFSIYKHWGVSKFTSLGYQSQERFSLGGTGIEQTNAKERLPLWSLPLGCLLRLYNQIMVNRAA